jgi:hypothetical protein
MSIVGSLLSAGSSIAGGIMGANAAQDAATVETQAAQKAQALEKTNQDSAVGAQDKALSNITAAEQPYQAVGATASTNLAKQLSTGFQAPTLADAENTPGYQFTLEQGTKAIDQNAAANGTLMTGGTGKALEDYGQGLASTTYQQDYNNAVNTYMTNYQSLLGGATLGQNSTGQLAQANLTTAGNTANIDMTAGQQQALQINNAAAARASGYLGTAAAYSSMGGEIAGAGSNIASRYAGKNQDDTEA